MIGPAPHRQATFDSNGPESLALLYIAFPTTIFLAGWVVSPLGPIAAALVAIAVLAVVARRDRAAPKLGTLMLPILSLAALWTVAAGLGHWTYANQDWVVRDAVLVDLVRDPWPVSYHVDHINLVMRAPIGYFLPASLIGKLWGIAAAEQALMIWTIAGVALTFALMLRDRPPLNAAMIRIAIFIAFSGMDIVGTIAHYNPHRMGEHLEWWASIFQYSSQTTQLFWVPNHALPGWLAIAWLTGQDPKRLSPDAAILFVLLAPLWSPLTALGIAPIVGVALMRRARLEKIEFSIKALLDWRMLVPLVVCVVLVFPYLVAGSEEVPSGSNSDFRWVGEDIVPRYIEFILFEFVGFALLLLHRDPRHPLLWTAVITLLLLPMRRFGPFNDLMMRASIPGLTLLAIEMGRWLSGPRVFTRSRWTAIIGIVLLAIGAVTPFMEFARAFMGVPWQLDERASLVDVTRGPHYLTSPDHPWLRTFLKHDAR